MAIYNGISGFCSHNLQVCGFCIVVALLMTFIILKNVDLEYSYNLNTSYYGLAICLNSLLPVYFLGFCWCSVKL